MKKVLFTIAIAFAFASCSKLSTVTDLPTIESTETVHLKAGTTQNFVLPVSSAGDPYIVTTTSHLGVATINGNILTYTAPEVRNITNTDLVVSNEEIQDCNTGTGNCHNQNGIAPGGCLNSTGSHNGNKRHGRKGKHHRTAEQHFTVNFKITIEPNNDGSSINNSTYRK